MRTTLSQRAPLRPPHLIAACAFAAALLLLPRAPAVAQSGGVLTGRVTDARSAQPVASATVEIAGTRLAVSVGDDGRYRIANVPAGTHSVSARRLGYSQLRRSVTVTAGQEATADFALQQTVTSLDEVVVTGTAGGEQLRSIGNSVSTIDAAVVLQQSAAPNLGSLLAARAPGVVISPGSGRVGAGPAINIRGRSSIGLGNSPLIYIDGVRVNNSVGTGPVSVPGGLAGQASQVAGRLNDINPEDIERIEIIKGPAASTIYGTEASSGVIQIITKKGSSGSRTSSSVQVQEGAIWFRDAEGRIPTNYFRNTSGEIVTWNGVKQEKDRGTPLFRTGEARQVTAAVSGGRDDLRYYVSSSFQDEQGIEPNNGLKQFGIHANLGVAVSPKLDISTSLNYVDLRSRLGVDFGASSMLGAMFGHGLVFTNARGFGLGFLPEVTQQLWDNTSNVNRVTASGTIAHTPTTWLRQQLVVGLDYTGDDSRALERFAPPELAATLPAATAAGRIGQTLRRLSGITANYTGTASFALSPALSEATSFGVQIYRDEQNESRLGGFGFPGVGIETVSGAAQQISATQTYQLNTTIGAFLQQKFNWRERLFLTSALRVDNNSAFGEEFKWIAYPKFDAAWVISEEPFFPWKGTVSGLRLRAAYGESGRQPQTFSALRTFLPVQGPGGSNAVTPGSIGNPDLKPERGKETELGFEAAFLERINIDFTYFSKRTQDLIINQAIAPSTGFAGNRPMNLGRVDNSGMELATTARLLTGRRLQWDVTASVATNKDEIKDLGGVPSVIVNAGQYNAVGYPIGGIFTRRVISADRLATGGPTNILCEGPDGAGVACGTAPFVYIGTPTPRTTGAIANTITIGQNLRLFGLVDFKRGHRVFNANELLRCSGAVGALLCEANYYPEKYSPVYLAEAANALTRGTQDQFYQSGSFAKLRELSASYTIPQRWTMGAQATTLTLAMRELHTWTNYRGLDPEANTQSVAGSLTQDQAQTPALTRFTATLNVRF
jgi:TonB-linked SusC/RagA family outer membrane protein